ncbi:MAG TPA: hypothetical protein VE912_09880, partial [Bacteroidales bacterium]|nr:hypothetical protein [Bacteroidales bacterium]
MFRKVVFILIVLLSLDFFKLSIIPDPVQKSFEFLGIGLTLFFFILYYLYDRNPGIPENYQGPVIMIILSVFISMFGAMNYHEQSFGLTLWGERFVFFYFFYFLLSKLRIEPDYIIRVAVIIGFSYMFIYMAQYILFPREILSARMFMDRGTLRIFMPGSNYLVFGYFICLYYFFRNYRKIYVIYLILSLVIYILLGTRQV